MEITSEVRMDASDEETIGKFVGQGILDARIDDNQLKLTFLSGEILQIWDNGQSCCETRYMSTDDDLKTLNGHNLTAVNVKVGENLPAGGEEHEVCFVEIQTDGGFVTIANHNEHNGWYGGFGLAVVAHDA